MSGLKPFQKVLTRESATDNWFVDFFGEYGNIECPYITIMHPYGCDYCISYEGHEDYLGTNKAEERKHV